MAAARDTTSSLDDRRVEAFGMLKETHDELLHALNRRLEGDGGIPHPWFGVLVRLARSPENRMRMAELARDMTMSASGLTRLVDRIEAAGHVRREACPSDRRGFNAVLTESGEEVIRQLAPGHLEDLERYLGAALEEQELDRLVDLLRRVRNHARAEARC